MEKEVVKLGEVWCEVLSAGSEVFGVNILVEGKRRPGKVREFEGVRGFVEEFGVLVNLKGTEFQKQVWGELRKVPEGQVVSYSELAKRIGRGSAVRGVARAVAANKVALVIPCHRVVRSDGGIGGFKWGIELKRELLKMEGYELFSGRKN